jgi:hypothetical protein
MKYTFISIIFLLLFSCREQIVSDGFEYVIRFSEKNMESINCPQFIIDYKKTTDIPLSKIAKDINYIKLETKPECTIGKIGQLFISDKYIITNDLQTKSIFLFTREGKYFSKIDKKGSGPEEYQEVSSISVDFVNENIMIYDNIQSKVLIYSFLGQCNTSFKKHARSLNACMINENRIAFYTPELFRNNESKDGELTLFDKQGNYIKSFFSNNEKDNKKPPFMLKYAVFYKYNNNICCILPFNDTIYRLTDTLTPRAIIDYGDLRFEPSLYSDYEKYQKEGSKYVTPGMLFESNKYILFSFYIENSRKNTLILKHDQTTFTTLESGFKNDFDNMLDFWPSYIDNEFVLGSINAHELIDIKENYIKAGLTNKWNTKLLKLIEDTKPTDNPIIIMLSL